VEIEQSFQIPFPADAVWRRFQDCAGIVACLPGASLTGAPEGGKLPLAMTVKLGPIVASFAGEAQMNLDDAQRTGSVTGGGSDRKSGSRVKGSARFSLHEVESGQTRVDIAVEYAIAGSLAQFSRGGIVQELAERLTLAFRDNLKTSLEAGQPVSTVPAAAPAATPVATDGAPAEPAVAVVAVAATAAAPAAPAALDLGGMFWALLVRRLRRLFGLAARS
jgi:carbon monoxide dehydrogenase subunit G